MTGIEIATCGPERAAVVHALTLAAFAPYAALDPPSGALAESEQLVAAELAAGGGLLAVQGGVPAGCLRFATRDGAVLVRRVAVAPEWQGRGIGRALMAEAERVVAARGVGELRLGVRVALPGNLAFYRRLGYRPVAEHRRPDGSPFWVELAKQLVYPGTAYTGEAS